MRARASERPPPRFMRPLPSPLAQLSSRYNIVVYSEPRLRSVNHPSPVLPLPTVGGSTGNNPTLRSPNLPDAAARISRSIPFPFPSSSTLLTLAFTLFSSFLPSFLPFAPSSRCFSGFSSFFFSLFTSLGDLQHQRQMRDRRTIPSLPSSLRGQRNETPSFSFFLFFSFFFFFVCLLVAPAPPLIGIRELI